MRRTTLFVFVLFLMACCKKDDPKPPMPANLVFPQKNSECTTGEAIKGANTTMVTFTWQASDHTESYELTATNLITNTAQTIVSSGTSAKLPIEKGMPYAWYVVSKNTKIPETAQSDTWQFYNAGASTSHAPFPAEVLSPKTGTTITRDINNEVLLAWQGADLDQDILSYKVYFSTETPPRTLIATRSHRETNLKVSVSPNSVYYWQIVTVDMEGNTATNTISEFKVY